MSTVCNLLIPERFIQSIMIPMLRLGAKPYQCILGNHLPVLEQSTVKRNLNVLTSGGSIGARFSFVLSSRRSFQRFVTMKLHIQTNHENSRVVT